MDKLKKLVFLFGCILFFVWFWPNLQMLTGDDEGTIRLVLAGFFSLAILFRLKPRTSRSLGGTWGIVGAGIFGAALAVTGLMFTIHQFEWLGIILVLYASLRWSLPDRWSSDIVRSMFVLYWIHPLPGRLFGWFEILMQKLSVSGSEWMLHILNVRIWAEGIYLRTGNYIFGVPEACSGMRTAVTMLICILGVSILFRQRWWETIVFMLLGSIQVLLLNIVRISFMVYWSQRMPQAWSETFLHDSLGFFLLISIFLVQAEMSWWKIRVIRARKRKEQIENDEIEAPDMANTLPRIWYLILISAKWVALVLVIVLGLAFASYKRRPFHKAAMISDVVDGLVESDPAAAEAAVNDALSYQPGSRSLLQKKAHILILREKFDEVLEVIDQLGPGLDTFETVMKSWALMSLERPEEAMALVNALPASQQNLPGVAIVKAEYAVTLKDVQGAASNIVVAAKSAFTADRIRGVYPFLASHQQWEAIAESNNFDVPFEDVVSALIVIQAYIKERDQASASRALDMALGQWPDEPALLRALYYMATTNPDSKWPDLFAENFVSNVASFSADETADRMNMAFQLGRADLGWLAYTRLSSLDPKDPELLLAPARYGRKWFLFRQKRIGIPSLQGRTMIDLGPFINYSRSSQFFARYWRHIPLADDFFEADSEMFRAQMLRQGIEEYERRLAAGNVSQRIESAYPVALGIAGRFSDAHEFFKKLAAKYPDRADDILFQRASLYHSAKRWEDSYEQLRKFFEIKDRPNLNAYLMLVDDLVSLNQGIYALDVLQEAKQLFPGAKEIELAEAALWNVFGFRDMSLHLLGDEGKKAAPFMHTRLLWETGRYREAERAANVLGVRPPPAKKTKQILSLPPAELSIKNRWPKQMTEEERREYLQDITEMSSRLSSPFLKTMYELEAEYLQGVAPSVSEWSKVGRNPRERASALHRLSVLAGRQGEFQIAVSAAKQALIHLPKSPVLWRILIALSKGDRGVVEDARKQCPQDPEIWLASVVTQNYSGSDTEMVLVDMQETVSRKSFPLETYIRASEFLLRKRQYEAAFMLADAVEAEGSDLLAANMLTMRCALIRKNYKKALSSALNCVKNSLDPSPFYEMIVALKSAGRQADSQLIEALEQLTKLDPDNTKWSENLGMAYFEKGDTVRALSVLNELMKKDIRKVTARSLMLAAESARIENEIADSIDILRAARKLYPENDLVLNNLVYSMAQDRDTLEDAFKLLPELEQIKDKSFHVYDTMAMVYMKRGSLQKASECMDKALKLLDLSRYSANDVKLNSAELLIRLNQLPAARARIQEVRADKDRSDAIDRRARQLLTQIDSIR